MTEFRDFARTIALIDPVKGGHHQSYLQLFTRTLLAFECRVLAFCPYPDQIAIWVGQHCSAHVSNFQAFPISEPRSFPIPLQHVKKAYITLARWYVVVSTLRNVSTQYPTKIDLIFFPWMDSYLYYVPPTVRFLIAHFFPYRWSGLYFHPTYFRRPNPTCRNRECDRHLIFKSSLCQAVAVLDEGVIPALRRAVNDKLVIRFPDVADASAPNTAYSLLKEIRIKARGRKIIGLIGSLEKRKGIITLMQVAHECINENWYFVFAGQLIAQTFSSEELSRIEGAAKCTPPENCHFHFERIPGEPEFNALVQECDVLFAAYVNFAHSSNILTKAAIFEKHVIVADGYCMAERVRTYQMGLIVDEDNAHQCIEALRCLLNSNDRSPIIAQADFEGFRRRHSAEQLQLAFRELLVELQ